MSSAIRFGERHNSMFEPNSISCNVSKLDMERFYQDSKELSSDRSDTKSIVMHRYNIFSDCLGSHCNLIIEL